MSDSRASWTGQIRVVAELMGLAHRRDLGTWRLPLLVSLLFATLFAATGAILAPLRERAENATFRVSVEGDFFGGAEVLNHLADYSLRPYEADDASIDVEGQSSSLGLIFGPGVDTQIAAGLEPDIEVFYREGQHSSVEAHTRFQLAMDDLLHGETAGVDIVFEDPRDDPDVNRIDFSYRLAGVVSILAGGSIATAGSVLGGLRDQRGVDALLVQPIQRSAIVVGTAVGTFPLATTRLLLASVGILLVGTVPVATLGLPVAELGRSLLVLPLACGLLGVLVSSVGQLAASLGGGSDDNLALGDLLALPFILLGVLVFLAPTLPLNAVTCAVPGLGILLAVREAMQGGDVGLWWILIIASALLTAAGTLWAASRLISAERWVLRSSG